MTNHRAQSAFKMCVAVRKDGERCSNVAVDGGDYCWFHSPLMEGARQEARSKGGHNRRDSVRVEKLLPETLRASITLTIRSMRDVANKSLEPARGQAIAALGVSLVRQYEAGVRVEQLGGIEAMLTGGASAEDAPEGRAGNEDDEGSGQEATHGVA